MDVSIRLILERRFTYEKATFSNVYTPLNFCATSPHQDINGSA